MFSKYSILFINFFDLFNNSILYSGIINSLLDKISTLKSIFFENILILQARFFSI